MPSPGRGVLSTTDLVVFFIHAFDVSHYSLPSNGSCTCDVSKEGRLVGPFPPGMIAGVHISWMGVVPKGHQRNK